MTDAIKQAQDRADKQAFMVLERDVEALIELVHELGSGLNQRNVLGNEHTRDLLPGILDTLRTRVMAQDGVEAKRQAEQRAEDEADGNVFCNMCNINFDKTTNPWPAESEGGRLWNQVCGFLQHYGYCPECYPKAFAEQVITCSRCRGRFERADQADQRADEVVYQADQRAG